MPRIEREDYYDHGNFTVPGGGPYSAISGSPTKDTQIVRPGDPASLLIDTVAATEKVEYDLPSSPTRGWRGFFWRMDFDNGESPTIAQMWAPGFTSPLRLNWVTSIDALQHTISGGSGEGVVVTPGEWHWIEQILDVSGATHTAYTRVDGVDFTPVSVGSSASSVDAMDLGVFVATGTYRYAHHLHGSAVSITDWLGAPPIPDYAYMSYGLAGRVRGG